MGARQSEAVRGRFGVVANRQSTVALGQVKETDDGKRRRELVDEDHLDDETQAALEADNFVIYGKASVEQYDDDEPSQKLTMDALRDAFPQLYEDGIISRRHSDIPVGEVLSEWELDEPTTIEVGDGEVHEFDAGDVLQTHIDDGEFWIVANIKANSEIAKETRLRSLSGDLDGFSVTIYAKEWVETDEGQRVTELDWHAVTIGTDEKIKNKDSRFDVAAYKARLSSVLPDWATRSDETNSADEVARSLHQQSTQKMTDRFNQRLFMKAASELEFDEDRVAAATELAEKADEVDGDEFGQAAEEVAKKHDVEPDAVVETLKALSGDDLGQKADEDVEQILALVEDEIGEDAAEALRDAVGGDSGNEATEEASDGEMKEEDEDDEDDDEDEDDEEEDSKSMSDELPDNVVTEEQLSEKLEQLRDETATEDDIEDLKSKVATADDIEDLREDQKAAMEEALPEIVEDVGEKMATGGTSDPAGGNEQASTDYTSQIQNAMGSGE